MLPLPPPTPAQPRRSSWRRWLARVGLVLLMIVGLALGVYAYLLHLADQRLRQVVAALDQADPGWRMHDIEAAREVIPDEQNGALVVLAVGKLLPEDWPPKDFEELFKGLEPDTPLGEEQLGRLRQELDRLGRALTEARRLKDLPKGRFPFTWSVADINKPNAFPHLAQASAAFRLLAYDALLRAEANDADGALVSCRAAVNAGRPLGDEPRMISQLVRIGCLDRALRTIERTLAQGEPGAEGLEALQHLLEDEEAQPLLLVTLRGQRADSHEAGEALWRGEITTAQLMEEDNPPFAAKILVYFGRIWFRWEHARLLEYETEYVEAARLPEGQRYQALHQVDARIRSEKPSFASMMVRVVGVLPRSFQRNQALLRCAIVMLAVERYRLAHQRWPESLDVLAPPFLPGAPLDPFDGKPLRLHRLADGVVIYSVGPDGNDNGGQIDRINPTAPGTDLGFRLWDVVQRRQPPTPKPAGPDPEDR